MKLIILSTLVSFAISSCAQPNESSNSKIFIENTSTTNVSAELEAAKITENATLLKDRFAPPTAYQRTTLDAKAYGTFLRSLPLKKYGSPVLYFNGAPKLKENIYCSVIDLPIGSQDLHQCADAVMNLWGTYLFSLGKYNEIQFKFLGDNAWHNYAKWLGKRKSTSVLFFKYMQQVWSAANTRSLYGQMKPVNIADAKIGDVLIVTGNPYGHAITLVDECINVKTGKKLFMLAQSYMPAQETQILVNPNSESLSPWYDLENNNGKIITPEWDFTTKDLRRF